MCDGDILPRSLEKAVWADEHHSDPLIRPDHQGFEMPSSSCFDTSFGAGTCR